MSLRDHRRDIAAGGFEKIQTNDATLFYVKETLFPIPIVRIEYQGGRSGSVRFFNVKQGDKYTAPAGSVFTEIFLENDALLSLQTVITVGQGDFNQNEINGSVNILGGSVDTIINPVTVIPDANKENCFPVQNCEVGGVLAPLLVQEINPASGGGSNTRFMSQLANDNLAPAANSVIAANPDRLEIIITNSIDSFVSIVVGAQDSPDGVGEYVVPGESVRYQINSEIKVSNPFDQSATFFAIEVLNDEPI